MLSGATESLPLLSALFHPSHWLLWLGILFILSGCFFPQGVAGSLLGGVRGDVLDRALGYWKNIDPDVGQRIEDKVRAGSAEQPAEGMGEA